MPAELDPVQHAKPIVVERVPGGYQEPREAARSPAWIGALESCCAKGSLPYVRLPRGMLRWRWGDVREWLAERREDG